MSSLKAMVMRLNATVERHPIRLCSSGRLLLAFTICSCSAIAWAHNPLAECKAVDAQTIECIGRFSDGSAATGVTLDVLSYDDKLLMQGKLDSDSKLRFQRPDEDFYVLFDAGPGHVVEIDQAEIDGTD